MDALDVQLKRHFTADSAFTAVFADRVYGSGTLKQNGVFPALSWQMITQSTMATHSEGVTDLVRSRYQFNVYAMDLGSMHAAKNAFLDSIRTFRAAGGGRGARSTTIDFQIRTRDSFNMPAVWRHQVDCFIWHDIHE